MDILLKKHDKGFCYAIIGGWVFPDKKYKNKYLKEYKEQSKARKVLFKIFNVKSEKDIRREENEYYERIKKRSF